MGLGQRSRRIVWALLLSALFAAAWPVSAANGLGPFWLTADEGFVTVPIEGPVTLTTRLEFGAAPGDVAGVWLAGLGTAADAPPTALALSWSATSTGWFGPTWGLNLQSDAGYLPSDLSASTGTGFLRGSQYVRLATLAPQRGHVYETVWSYDPHTGMVGLALDDLTAGEHLFTTGFETSLIAEQLYAGLGVQAGAATEQVGVAAFEHAAGFTPVGLTWRLVQRGASERTWISSTRVDRRQQSAVAIDVPWTRLQGDLRITVGQGDASWTAAAPAAQGRTVLHLDPAKLPVGRSRLLVEYVEGESAVPVGTAAVNVGLLTAWFDDLTVDSKVPGVATFTGTLHLVPDGPGVTGSLRIVAHLSGAFEEEGAVRAERLPEEWVLAEIADLDVPATGVRLPFVADLMLPADRPERVLAWNTTLDVVFDGAVSLVRTPTEVPTPAPPSQIVLTWEDDPQTSATLTWRTHTPVPSALYLSPAGGRGELHRIETEQLGFPEMDGWLHRTRLVGLNPGTQYIAVAEAGHFQAEPFAFRTMPPPGQPRVFASLGSQPAARVSRQALHRLAAELDPDFVMVPGGFVSSPGNAAEWDEWFHNWDAQMVTATGRRIPVVPAIGPTEVNGRYDRPKEYAFTYYHRFALPAIGSYYALPFGSDLVLITLDSGHTARVREGQRHWLEGVLREFQNSRWLIVQYADRALTPARALGEQASEIRTYWLPLFEEYGVDLVIEGGTGIYLPRDAKAVEWSAGTGSDPDLLRYTLGTDELRIEPLYLDNAANAVFGPPLWLAP